MVTVRNFSILLFLGIFLGSLVLPGYAAAYAAKDAASPAGSIHCSEMDGKSSKIQQDEGEEKPDALPSMPGKPCCKSDCQCPMNLTSGTFIPSVSGGIVSLSVRGITHSIPSGAVLLTRVDDVPLTPPKYLS